MCVLCFHVYTTMKPYVCIAVVYICKNTNHTRVNICMMCVFVCVVYNAPTKQIRIKEAAISIVLIYYCTDAIFPE